MTNEDSKSENVKAKREVTSGEDDSDDLEEGCAVEESSEVVNSEEEEEEEDYDDWGFRGRRGITIPEIIVTKEAVGNSEQLDSPPEQSAIFSTKSQVGSSTLERVSREKDQSGAVTEGEILLKYEGEDIGLMTELERSLIARIDKLNPPKRRKIPPEVNHDKERDVKRSRWSRLAFRLRCWTSNRPGPTVPATIACAFCAECIHFPIALPCGHLACLECITVNEAACGACGALSTKPRTLNELSLEEGLFKRLEREKMEFLELKARHLHRHRCGRRCIG